MLTPFLVRLFPNAFPPLERTLSLTFVTAPWGNHFVKPALQSEVFSLILTSLNCLCLQCLGYVGATVAREGPP